MPNEVLRTFIAIELDEPLRIAIARVQGKFKRQAPTGSIKWVAPEGIHLTLKFLGDTPAGRVGEIAAALRVLRAQALRRSSSAWKGAAAFRTRGGPRRRCGWGCATKVKCSRVAANGG